LVSCCGRVSYWALGSFAIWGDTVNTLSFASVALLIFALNAEGAGQGFKPYPGAVKYTPDTKETRVAMQSLPPGTTSTVYLTNDSFEKVVAFYKASAKEYKIPGMPEGGKLPTGQELKKTILIFDGAADIATSKNWATVQHPFIGSIGSKGGLPGYNDIRDVTAIMLAEKK
jgi:hypothetical protein